MIFFLIFMVLPIERETTYSKHSTLSSNWNNCKEEVKQHIPKEANCEHKYNSRYSFWHFYGLFWGWSSVNTMKKKVPPNVNQMPWGVTIRPYMKNSFRIGAGWSPITFNQKGLEFTISNPLSILQSFHNGEIGEEERAAPLLYRITSVSFGIYCFSLLS